MIGKWAWRFWHVPLGSGMFLLDSFRVYIPLLAARLYVYLSLVVLDLGRLVHGGLGDIYHVLLGGNYHPETAFTSRACPNCY